MKAIYRESFKYAKAGVMLLDLQPDHQQQRELDLEDDCGEDRPQLMTAGVPGLVDETGTQDAAVHDAVGGYCGGAGLISHWRQKS